MAQPISLSRSIKPIDLPSLTNVKGVYEYMLGLPRHVALWPHWQHAAWLCTAAMERPTARAVAKLTDQLELALVMSSRLDLSAQPKRPPAPSIRVAERQRVRQR
jgi:hypothetical protein